MEILMPGKFFLVGRKEYNIWSSKLWEEILMQFPTQTPVWTLTFCFLYNGLSCLSYREIFRLNPVLMTLITQAVQQLKLHGCKGRKVRVLVPMPLANIFWGVFLLWCFFCFFLFVCFFVMESSGEMVRYTQSLCHVAKCRLKRLLI